MYSAEMTEWLNKIQTIHVQSIQLGLERVELIARRLNLIQTHATVITVGGTNGKGSSVAGLEAIYLAEGYKVGVFTTPYLVRHNEIVRIMGKDMSDDHFVQAYKKIDQYRNNIPLTQFEFNTLAALILFQQAGLDIWILEVGLGGRLDAVNIIDADLALITSIDIDHVDWLGDTREKIGFEKAGIFRPHTPVVCGDEKPPQSLIKYAKKMQAPFYELHKTFGFEDNQKTWAWWSEQQRLENLPRPPLALKNMATVLMAVECLQSRNPVTLSAIEKGLAKVHLPGRIQVFPGSVRKVLDVAHNPASTKLLAHWIETHSVLGKTYAVFSMLGDKDIAGSIQPLLPLIDDWFVAPLSVPRSASLQMLKKVFPDDDPLNEFPNVIEAYHAAVKNAESGDQIIIFGSFYTLSEILQAGVL